MAYQTPFTLISCKPNDEFSWTRFTLMGPVSLECEQLWLSKTSYSLQVLVMFVFLTSLPLCVLLSIHIILSGRWPIVLSLVSFAFDISSENQSFMEFGSVHILVICRVLIDINLPDSF